MIPEKRGRSWLSVLGITLGALGIAACLAVTVLVWIASARIRTGIDVVFGRIDGSLDGVEERLVQARDGVQGATTSADELVATLRDKAAGLAASQPAEWRLQVAERAGRLSAALEQADRWLEVSETWVVLFRERLSVSASTGVVEVKTTPADQLLETIASLRLQVDKAAETVDRIRERLAETRGAESRETRNGPAEQLAERAVATLGSVHSGLVRLTTGIAVTQTRLQETRSDTKRQVLLGTWGVTLLLLWMGAGQFALCRLAWRRPS